MVEADAGATVTPLPVRLGRVYIADFDQTTPALPAEDGLNTRAVRACAVGAVDSNTYSVWRFVVQGGRIRRVFRVHSDPLNERIERCLMTALRSAHLPDGTPDGPFEVSLSFSASDSLAR